MATHPLSQQNSFSKIFPGENSKVNYPNSRFTQQDLPAWQPIMTPIKVVILFLIITVIFIPVGISLVQSSDSVSFLFLSICHYHLIFSNFFLLFNRFMNLK